MLTGVLAAICLRMGGRYCQCADSDRLSSSEYLVKLSLSSLEHALLASHLPFQLLHTHQLTLCFLFNTLYTRISASCTHAMSRRAAIQLEHQRHNKLCQGTLRHVADWHDMKYHKWFQMTACKADLQQLIPAVAYESCATSRDASPSYSVCANLLGLTYVAM